MFMTAVGGISKRYRYSPSPGFINSNFDDLGATCLFSPSHQHHFKMSADLSFAASVLKYDVQYIHYTLLFCWLYTIRRNSGWAIELTQISTLHQKLKTSVISYRSQGQFQLVRVPTSLQHYCISLTQIWEISPMYTLPQVLYPSARFILMFHYALQTQRWRVPADKV